MKKLGSVTLFIVAILILGGCTRSPSGVSSMPSESGTITEPSVDMQNNENEYDDSLPTQAYVYYVIPSDPEVGSGITAWSGTSIGCDDLLISMPITFETQFSGWQGLLNTLYQMQLGENNKPDEALADVITGVTLDQITLQGSTANIYLSGSLEIPGVCAHPRIEAQLKSPALQFSGITTVEVFINNQPLSDLLDVQG